MTLAEQYDAKKQETADRSREMDAIDEALNDIQYLRDITTGDFGVTLEAIIKDVEESIHYEESLEYILTLIPDTVKSACV
jgi:hypothetical protein